MTKQEEIREGLARVICDRICGRCATKEGDVYNELEEEDKNEFRPDADEILKYLNDNGVVIKVDRELPEFLPSLDFFRNTEDTTKQKMLDAGYVATEPLIEVK